MTGRETHLRSECNHDEWTSSPGDRCRAFFGMHNAADGHVKNVPHMRSLRHDRVHRIGIALPIRHGIPFSGELLAIFAPSFRTTILEFTVTSHRPGCSIPAEWQFFGETE